MAIKSGLSDRLVRTYRGLRNGYPLASLLNESWYAREPNLCSVIRPRVSGLNLAGPSAGLMSGRLIDLRPLPQSYSVIAPYLIHFHFHFVSLYFLVICAIPSCIFSFPILKVPQGACQRFAWSISVSGWDQLAAGIEAWAFSISRLIVHSIFEISYIYHPWQACLYSNTKYWTLRNAKLDYWHCSLPSRIRGRNACWT